MAKRDYYEVLGISRTATADEIKKAHRKLVRQHHPDVNKNNKASEEKFKEAQEAYDVLSDAAKRKAYDQFGHAGVGAGGPGGAGGNGDPWRAAIIVAGRVSLLRTSSPVRRATPVISLTFSSNSSAGKAADSPAGRGRAVVPAPPPRQSAALISNTPSASHSSRRRAASPCHSRSPATESSKPST
jgi:curved DNA-binding protein CbpA